MALVIYSRWNIILQHHSTEIWFPLVILFQDLSIMSVKFPPDKQHKDWYFIYVSEETSEWSIPHLWNLPPCKTNLVQLTFHAGHVTDKEGKWYERHVYKESPATQCELAGDAQSWVPTSYSIFRRDWAHKLSTSIDVKRLSLYCRLTNWETCS